MVEYLIAAIAGAILASTSLLAVRLLSQQRDRENYEAAIRRHLDAIRRAGAAIQQDIATALASRETAAWQLTTALEDSQRTMRQLIDRLDAEAGGIAKFHTKLGSLSASRDTVTDDLIAIESEPSGPVFTSKPGTSIQGSENLILPSQDSAAAAGAVDGPELGGAYIDLYPPPSIEIGTSSSASDFSSRFDPTTDYRREAQTSPVLPDSPYIVTTPDIRPPAAAVQDAEAEAEQRRVVDLMFATTRKYDDVQERFTGERNQDITFGQAFVRVPEAHFTGQLERPSSYTFFSLTLYRQKEDPKKHFVIRDIVILPRDRWPTALRAMPGEDALVFVHGFNTGFEDALYRNAQIVYDLRFEGTPVLFSWPSRGTVKDYVYDRDSATGARGPFLEVLELLSGAGIKQVHILAHSMGNMVVLDALDRYQPGAVPLPLGELMMAAPDVDRDVYRKVALSARKYTKGMTLYASAADKALLASKLVAGDIPRAGDVPSDGPIVLPQIDSIDATFLGDEIFGLNHATFAKSLSILNDVRLTLGGMRPPDKRVLEIRSVPEGVDPPKYWQYFAGR